MEVREALESLLLKMTVVQLSEMLGFPCGAEEKEGQRFLYVTLPGAGTISFTTPVIEDYEFQEFKAGGTTSLVDALQGMHLFLGGRSEKITITAENPTETNHLRSGVDSDTLPKSGGESDSWSTAYVNDLPDSAFLYIEEGGTEEDGKTTPRSLRHLPYKNAEGEVDLPHLRNALARINQVQDKDGNNLSAAVQERIRTTAQRILEHNKEQVTAVKEHAIIERESSVWNSIKTMVNKLFNKKKAQGGFFFYQKDGVDRWALVSSTIVQDRDGEIVSKAALSATEGVRLPTGDFGPLRFWHTPGIDLGVCDFRLFSGACLIESGVWYDTPEAKSFKEAVEKSPEFWGVSIGFLADPTKTDVSQMINGRFVSKIFNSILIIERSLVPATKASNPLTRILMRGGNMEDQKLTLLKQVLGEDLATKIAAQVDSDTQKALSGVFKEYASAEDILLAVADVVTDVRSGVLLREAVSAIKEQNIVMAESLLNRVQEGISKEHRDDINTAKAKLKASFIPPKKEDEEEEGEDKPKKSEKAFPTKKEEEESEEEEEPMAKKPKKAEKAFPPKKEDEEEELDEEVKPKAKPKKAEKACATSAEEDEEDEEDVEMQSSQKEIMNSLTALAEKVASLGVAVSAIKEQEAAPSFADFFRPTQAPTNVSPEGSKEFESATKESKDVVSQMSNVIAAKVFGG